MDVEGSGFVVGPQHATPWLRRAALHTRSSARYWWAEHVQEGSNNTIFKSPLLSGFPKR
jgi:hypothetical protein